MDPRIHKHRENRNPCFIEWCETLEIYECPRWIEPHGRQQLHFPRTRWIHNGPDLDDEDADGDIEMADADVDMLDADSDSDSDIDMVDA